MKTKNQIAPPPKTAKVRARKKSPAIKVRHWWAYPFEDGYVCTDVSPTAKDLKDGWCKPVFLADCDAASVEAMHRTIKIAMDLEDNTGHGLDHAAWRVMHRLGFTDLTWLRFYKAHIDKRAALTALSMKGGE